MICYENVILESGEILARVFNTETKETKFIKDIPEYKIYEESNSGEYEAFVSYPNKVKLKKNIVSKNDYYSLIRNSKYGRTDLRFEYISKHYPDSINQAHPFKTWYLDIEVSGKKDSGWNKSMGAAWKPEVCSQEITLIQFYDTYEETYYVLSLKEYSGNNLNDINLKKLVFDNEESMLKSFVEMVKESKPAIITAWNGILYDFPYLINRIAKICDKSKSKEDVTKGYFVRRLSPFNIVRTNKDGDYQVLGIFLEDLMDVYKKYTFNSLDSFSLDSVCEFELGEKKISHSEYLDFTEFYQKDFNKFYEYGVRDVELMFRLDNKLKLLELAIFIAYMCGVTLDDVKGTLRQWNNYAYNEGLKRNIIFPFKSPYTKENDKFVGGLVHSSRACWEYVVSFDFTSLYPSIISWCNLGGDTIYHPTKNDLDLLDLREKFSLKILETDTTEDVKLKIIEFVKNNVFDSKKVDYCNSILEKHNLSMTPNGMFFTKSKKSLFAELMENLLKQRQSLKKKMKEAEKLLESMDKESPDYNKVKLKKEFYDTNQIALKVLANSAYGILSMDACIFAGSSKYFSNSITYSGQVADVTCALIAGKIVDSINERIPETERVDSKRSKNELKWIACADTDSFYVCLEPLVKYKEINTLPF